MSAHPVEQLLAAIEAGAASPPELFADEVRFDARVPNWRFTVLGSEAVCDQLAEMAEGDLAHR